MEQASEPKSSPTGAPHEGSVANTTSNEHVSTEAMPPSFRNLNRENGQLPIDAPFEADDENDLADIFEDDDNFEDEEWDADASDLTKNYNRQRQLHDTSSQAVPRSNAQKPTANTMASIDDQISSLSRHAAKIRLDDVKQGENREKDKADRATSELVLDQRTRMILLQMINKGVVSEVHGAISTGKEANVYGAVSIATDDGPAVQRAVKVYKTAILVFKDRERYITGEHRFKSGSEKGNNRKMVKLWAEKEFRNLRRLHDAGISCPEPIQLKLHVLVMSFLGNKRGWAYPRLRDANIGGEDVDQQWRNLYIQLLGVMRRMYQVCGLVHADLSEYNILYNDKTLYIIDVSQSVGHDHPRSNEFLRMDIKNVGDFFRRKGVDTLQDKTIFNFIITPKDDKHPVDEPASAEAIEALYESRPAVAEGEDAEAQLEVDNEVFRKQYIPQTLNQVYDVEKEGLKIDEGLGSELPYRNLLADQVVHPTQGEAEEVADAESSDDDSGSGVGLDDDESEQDARRDSGWKRPRGQEKKDEKTRQEIKDHKKAVKEAQREKRKEKMPKHVKKRLVAATSRKNK